MADDEKRRMSPELIYEALLAAVRQAAEEHRALGQPMVVCKLDGTASWVPAEQVLTGLDAAPPLRLAPPVEHPTDGVS